MKPGHVLAAIIAVLVAAFAAIIISGVLLLPFSAFPVPIPVGPLLWSLRVIVFGIVFVVVFREMSEKFAR